MLSTLRFSLLAVLGGPLIWISTGAPASAQADTQVVPLTEPLVVPVAAGETTNYSDEAMSVDFPADWTIEVTENGEVMIASVTTTQTDLVATQIARIAAPPGAVVDANIDSFIAEGSAVGQYRTVKIDGQTALVIWLSERPDSLSEAIATFIDYGDETVLLFSRYSPENSTAEEEVLQLHTSYSNLSADSDLSAGPESEPEAE